MNVAARVEGVAEPGGIAITRSVHEQVRDKLDIGFVDKGDVELKNIQRPVQVFLVAGAARIDSVVTTLALPDKPSIAVLPFQNMSGDADQEFFADGIAEDIITELSRFKSLFVIARNSSFSYKGSSPDIRQVGKDLGVRYVLEGSVRKASNRIRVTGQLIDTLTGTHVWAERYERVLEDIFAVQEEVTGAIVAAIAPQIDTAEQLKANRRRPGDLSAYEIALRAWVHAWDGNDKAEQILLRQSIQEAKQALAIDPDSVLALHALSFALGVSVFLGMGKDGEEALRDATAAAGRAVELDGMNPRGYALRGFGAYLSLQLERYPGALADARRAYGMNPNDTFVLEILAHLEVAAGEPEQAIAHAQQILRLSPRQPRSHMTYNLLAYASHGAGQYDKGIEWASCALSDMSLMVQAQANLIVCLVGAGQIERAKLLYLAGARQAPTYFRERIQGTLPLARLDHRRRVQMFLRIAAGLEDPSAADALR